MKKAFTLIELLVVIAIIAILAAILFPVFAQAKAAAKKTAAISNGKQIGLGIMQYMADSDDTFPRNDDCAPGTSLNPALKGAAFNANGVGCTTAPFYNRMNHYAWQKWIYPYTKNVDMFFHPAIGKYDTGTPKQWSENGQIMGSFGINLALTGALNTYNNTGGAGSDRKSFMGGTTGGIPDVAAAMLLVELVNPTINFAPTFLDSSSGTATRTAYPVAIKEMWAPNLYKTDANCVSSTEVNGSNLPFAGQMNLGFADGHMKSYSVGKFMAETPSAAEYTVSSRPACGLGSGAWTISSKPVWTKSWPLWALD
jgi:prepilin-type N-terminal cleavage/methylation domain-containing protein/prepilin-type processing-associated H-X9-DG protein